MSFSSQHHSFDIVLARAYGVDCAILIHHMQHWIRINKNLGKNLKDGRTWTYQTRKEILAHYPYMTFEQIKYTTERLVKAGVLITANYNKSPIDKTLWYAFKDEQLFVPDIGFSNNVYERENSLSMGKIPSPIPDTKTTYSKEEDKKEKKIQKQKKSAAPPPPSLSFTFNKVEMPKEAFDKLVSEYGHDVVMKTIQSLDDYGEIKAKKFKEYTSHAATVRNWIRKDLQSNKTPQGMSEVASLNLIHFKQQKKEWPSYYIDLSVEGNVIVHKRLPGKTVSLETNPDFFDDALKRLVRS